MRNAKGIHTRCSLHGGKCTGAKTAEGRERIGKANLKHGRYTKAAKARKRWSKGIDEFTRYLNDEEGYARLNALLELGANEVDKSLESGDDKRLAECCKASLEIMRRMTEPLERVAPFLGLAPRKRDAVERKLRRVLEAGAAGLGCDAYREALAKS